MSSYMELSLGESHPVVRINSKANIGSIETVLEDLIKPALLASGYQQRTVDKIVLSDEEQL